MEILEELGVHDRIGEPAVLPMNEAGDESVGQPSTISSSGFYGNQPQPQQQQQRQQQNRAQQGVSYSNANRGGPSSHPVFPIEGLTPYAGKWTIKARCTQKSEVKHWHNKSGEGKLFSVNLLDDTGEIRATGFNEQCSQLYDVFVEGSVYYISSPCKVQMAKKQFSNLPNDYELTFERDTLVEKVWRFS